MGRVEGDMAAARARRARGERSRARPRALLGAVLWAASEVVHAAEEWSDGWEEEEEMWGEEETRGLRGLAENATSAPTVSVGDGTGSFLSALLVVIFLSGLVLIGLRVLFLYNMLQRQNIWEVSRSGTNHTKKRRLRKAELNKYTELFTFKTGDDHQGGEMPTSLFEDLDGMCSICIDEFEDDEPCRRLPCGHKFHADCVEAWFKRSVECPLCKQDVRGPKEVDEDEDESNFPTEVMELRSLAQPRSIVQRWRACFGSSRRGQEPLNVSGTDSSAVLPRTELVPRRSTGEELGDRRESAGRPEEL